LKKLFGLTLLAIVFLSIGVVLGTIMNLGAYDIMCAKSQPYVLIKDMKGEGISIKSGTEIDFRFCEYTNRFTVNFTYDKGKHPEIFKAKDIIPNDKARGANAYSVAPAE